MSRLVRRGLRRVIAGCQYRWRRCRLQLFGQSALRQSTKIFCIGRNKTGTTSLQAFFSQAGFRVAPQVAGEKLIYNSGFEPDDKFWQWVDSYEVFQDAPFSWTWLIPELIQRYPDARFILSVRDGDDWFESLVNHQFEHLGLPTTASNEAIIERMKADTYVAPGYFYAAYVKQHGEPGSEPMYQREKMVSTTRHHNQEAQQLIPSDQLLTLDLSEHATTGLLCDFVGLPTRFKGPMPKANVRRS